MEKPLERNPIQTFVFLDIESTAVLAMDKPKMTEICLTAVHRKELLDFSRIRTKVGIRTPKLPRVTDSLSICLNPGKPVHSVAYELSGLDNTNLNGSCKRQFGELDATLLKLFLTRQARPICLIAHNGMKFDFPLLKAELKGINYNFPILDIKCGDTLQAFRDLDDGLDVKRELPKKWHVPFSQATKLANSPIIDMAGSEKKRLRTSVARCLFSKSLLPGSTQGASECIGHDPAQHIIVTKDHDRKLDVPDQHQSGLRVKRTCEGSQGFDLADSYKRPRKVDYIPTKDDPLRLATPSPPRRNGGRYSYKLVDVYQHMFGQLPDNAHHAVSDVNTLLAIFVARADSLIEYFENNSVNFGVIPIFYGKGA
ncbi:Three prime repair exonuclease 2 [Apostichopus japonicus]|uniref:Three prime repair exonuclease 2 n=1 Tax=Stichopus japonicus TaxID=307972 RepID=A0A2G8JVB3_STIJA|nr:Three prime repair exonuclease 2 [Apostichopus japonicus]